MGGGIAKPWIPCLAPATFAHAQRFCPLPGRRRPVNDQHLSWRSGPFAGSGIKDAIEDAVLTANLLAEPLMAGSLCLRDLAEVQRRREWPTRIIQALGCCVGATSTGRAKAASEKFQNSDHYAKCFLALA
jgi:hypothetical protein